jgi:serine/threonine protein kinase/Tol biopolymer transport system component
MGVVYSAYDTVLQRKVAIKVMVDRALREKSAHDMLLHEARAASSLNHPNICTIHEVGDSNGEAYIVMEQVEGQPLNSLVGTGGLPPDLVVRYGIQIADALAHAHEHGVIHRDLKSTNVVVTPEGRGKVLDFGLAARLRDSELAEATLSRAPLNESRILVGTLPYLAPELLRGEPAEARTDTWSLGILLYEMATGSFPFDGRTAFELSSAILREPPKPLPATFPSSLRAVIMRCLEKSPGDRYQQASDVRADLEHLKLDSDSELQENLLVTNPAEKVPDTSARPRLMRTAAITAGALFVLLAALLLYHWLWPLHPPRILRIVQLTHFAHVSSWGKINSDGARIFFLRTEPDRWSLMQVPVSGGESQPFPSPFRNTRILDLSPDRSEFLVEQFAAPGWDMEFWLLPVVGGSPRRLGDLTGNDGAFSPDGTKIAYSKVDGIYICSRNGRDAHKLVSLPSWGLAWSPDGKVLRFTLEDRKNGHLSLWEVSADGTNLHPLLPGWNEPSYECCGQWSVDGRYFIFVSSRGEGSEGIGSVWGRREKGSLAPWSKPSPPVRLTAAPLAFGFLHPSSDGTRLFIAGQAYARNELLRASRDKKSLLPVFSSSDVFAASLSPKGDWLALVLSGWTLWRSRPDGSERIQLAADFPGTIDKPHWSPDGTKIVFQARQEGRPANIYMVSADGGPPEELLPSDQPRESPDWSPDGESVVYSTPRFSKEASREDSGIFVLNLKTRKPIRVPGSEGLGVARLALGGRYLGALSEDGKKVMLFDFQTRSWKEIAHGKFFDHLERTPDAKYFYFQDVLDAGEPLYRIHVGDWKLETVMSFEPMLQADVVRCRFAGLMQDGSPMVIVVRGGGDIYELDLDLP